MDVVDSDVYERDEDVDDPEGEHSDEAICG